MIGPWKGLDGKVHDATGKTFELEFCTVARWQNGEMWRRTCSTTKSGSSDRLACFEDPDALLSVLRCRGNAFGRGNAVGSCSGAGARASRLVSPSSPFRCCSATSSRGCLAIMTAKQWIVRVDDHPDGRRQLHQ